MQPNYNSSYTPNSAPVPEGTIIVERGVSAQEFAPKLNRTAADVIRFLLQNGEMVTATMTLTDEQMELFALEIGAELLLVEPGQQEEMELQALFDDSDDDDETMQASRPPVITVMGHVDHGKSTLSDSLVGAAGIIKMEEVGDKRILDTRDDEIARGITIKSTAISMHYRVGADMVADLRDNERDFLINLIDFSSLIE